MFCFILHKTEYLIYNIFILHFSSILNFHDFVVTLQNIWKWLWILCKHLFHETPGSDLAHAIPAN